MGCDIHGFLEYRYANDKSWWDMCTIPDDRNYDLFGILAGVRNYVNATPISKPKGIPEDASYRVKDGIKDWGVDGHSHSWLTWKEIKEYNWAEKYQDGRVSTIVINTGKELGKASYTSLQEESAEELAKRGIKLVYLERTAKDLIPFEWKGFFDYMRYLAEGDESTSGYGDENVRIVFWFDN